MAGEPPHRATEAIRWQSTLTRRGPVGLSFYLDGQWLATSYQNIPFGTPPDIRFHGWVTDFDFDRVVIEYGQPVDNIHIVPGPSSVVAFACAVAFGHRRRRGASATSR
jgi:hypothetical protein